MSLADPLLCLLVLVTFCTIPREPWRKVKVSKDFDEVRRKGPGVLSPVIYAAREKNIYKVSSKELVNEIKAKHPGKEVYYFKDFDEIANFVSNNAEAGDLVITMGAGDIYKVADIMLERDWKKR